MADGSGRRWTCFTRSRKPGTTPSGSARAHFSRSTDPSVRSPRVNQLATDYREIIEQARADLHLDDTVPALLTGWSRGAAFAVLVASEPGEQQAIAGVVAIGLSEGEDLRINGAEDETDDGSAGVEARTWPFEPYQQIARLKEPCAVIQSSHDNYLPAARARSLFGPDSASRRFYTIDAKNHRFSGGKEQFDVALLEAIDWIASPPTDGASGPALVRIAPPFCVLLVELQVKPVEEMMDRRRQQDRDHRQEKDAAEE